MSTELSDDTVEVDDDAAGSEIVSDLGAFALVPVWVLHLGLSGSELAVYVSLRSFADGNGGNCYPSTKLIAERAGVAVGTVRNAVMVLRRKGALTTTKKFRRDGSVCGLRYLLLSKQMTPPSSDDDTNCPELVTTRPDQEPDQEAGRANALAPSPPDGLFEPPPKAKKRGSRLPAGFDVNDDMKAWKRENAPHVHLRNELAQFKDHWLAAAGASAVKLDWVAAWRTWMRRAEEDWLRRERQQQRPRPTGTRTRTDPTTGHMREEY